MDQPADRLPRPSGPPVAPPAPAPAPTFLSAIPPSQLGRLVPTWRFLFGLAWAAGFFAYAAVWQASVQLGIGLWWVGPRAQPTSVWLRMVPFVVCLAVAIMAAYNIRRLPEIGATVAIGMVVFAVPDLSRSTSLGLTEVTVALALLVVSVASATGRIRLSSPPAPATSDGDPLDG